MFPAWDASGHCCTEALGDCMHNVAVARAKNKRPMVLANEGPLLNFFYMPNADRAQGGVERALHHIG